MTRRADALALFRQLNDGENAGYTSEYFAALHADYTESFNGATVIRSREQLRSGVEGAKSTMPGMRREIQFCEATDDHVVAQYALRFTHNGAFGFPPTGQLIEVHGCCIYEFDGGPFARARFFTDWAEATRRFSGGDFLPGTASAARTGPRLPEFERARYEAVGETLGSRFFEAERNKDNAAMTGCFAREFTDHIQGHPLRITPAALAAANERLWAISPNLKRTPEEIISIGDRTAVRWHLTNTSPEGKAISQHGCSFFEHDGEHVIRTWAYFPNLLAAFPGIDRILAGGTGS